MSLPEWRRRVEPWIGDVPGAIPPHPDFGRRYPWRLVALHARSQAFRQRVRSSLATLEEARGRGLRWHLSLSGGKDSAALALLLDQAGWRLPAVTVHYGPRIDYPCKPAWVRGLAQRCVLDLHELCAPVDLGDAVHDRGLSLLDPLYTGRIAGDLYQQAFFEPLRVFREAHDLDAVLLGLRTEESRGRRLNRASRGRLYTRRDGLTICQPIVDWSAEDVHAFVWACGVGLSPVYLCVDPGQDWRRIREDGWMASGAPGQVGGHYTWLMRWWPTLFDRARYVDPAVRRRS